MPAEDKSETPGSSSWSARLLEGGVRWYTLAEGPPLTDPAWTLARGMGGLSENDLDMLLYTERLGMQIDVRAWNHQSVAVRLREHHHAAGESGETCQFCRTVLGGAGSAPGTRPSAGSDASHIEFDWERHARPSKRDWTVRRAMVELRERDQDMMSYLERMAIVITLLEELNATESAQLESHHKDLGHNRGECPICNNRSLFEEVTNDFPGVGRYLLLPLAAARYRTIHHAWPTTASGSDLSNPLGDWDEPLHAAVSERLDLTSETAGSQSPKSVIVRGPEGEAQADRQSVGFRTPAYDQAAEWLYGHQWSPGIETSWQDEADEWLYGDPAD